jgi:hypothetical protein
LDASYLSTLTAFAKKRSLKIARHSSNAHLNKFSLLALTLIRFILFALKFYELQNLSSRRVARTVTDFGH